MRANREDEFRAYVAEARPGLVRTATWLTAGDAHFAEDLVQTALTKLYVAWPRIRNADGPHAYARRTLVNALIDERRRPFWRKETSRAQIPDAAATDSEVELEPLRAALAELPAGMRAVIVFRYVHELSVAETAHALNCSEGNVKSQTARALERLRAVLGATPDEPNAAPALPSGPATHPSTQPLSRPHVTRLSVTIPRSTS
ncbi:MAG: putative polymerase ECF-subfamily sigma factor [Frankiales bacterium]|nr:putative polymerase ECF-subfamily sigma factor [Frankiales bacterium]